MKSKGNNIMNENTFESMINAGGTIALILVLGTITIAIIWFWSLLNTIWNQGNTKEIERRMKIIYDQETEKNRKLDRIIQLLENMQGESGEPGKQQNNSAASQWALEAAEYPEEKKSETRLSKIAKFLTKEL